MAIRISARNLNKDIRVDTKAIEGLAGKILRKERGKKRLGLDITFVDDAMMKRLNRRFMGKKRPTDVLSFSYGKDSADVIISSDTARSNAKRFGTGLKREIALYVIHGILHCLGYEDRTKAQRSRMREKENRLLEWAMG